MESCDFLIPDEAGKGNGTLFEFDLLSFSLVLSRVLRSVDPLPPSAIALMTFGFYCARTLLDSIELGIVALSGLMSTFASSTIIFLLLQIPILLLN